MMAHFDVPWLLWLLPLAPVLAWLGGRRRRRAAVRFSSRALLAAVRPTWRTRLAPALPLLRMFALACLIVALARPQKGIGEIRTSAEGVALMFVVDRSWSMNERLDPDEETTRIDVVKRLSKEFIAGNDRGLKGRPDDLIGLVTFGKFAETACPLVRIHETLVHLIDAIDLAHPQSIDAGTAIGEGLALAAARLRDAEAELARRNEQEDAPPDFTIKSKVIVLLTDGDENVTTIAATQAAQLCADWGIRVYAVGIGGGAVRTVQTPFGDRQITIGGGFNEQLLDSIAQTTGGLYRSAASRQALDDIYREIDRLEKTEIHSKEYTSYEELFLPWALAAASLLLAEVGLGSTWLRRTP